MSSRARSRRPAPSSHLTGGERWPQHRPTSERQRCTSLSNTHRVHDKPPLSRQNAAEHSRPRGTCDDNGPRHWHWQAETELEGRFQVLGYGRRDVRRVDLVQRVGEFLTTRYPGSDRNIIPPRNGDATGRQSVSDSCGGKPTRK